jgi:hypothetical protein
MQKYKILEISYQKPFFWFIFFIFFLNRPNKYIKKKNFRARIVLPDFDLDYKNEILEFLIFNEY